MNLEVEFQKIRSGAKALGEYVRWLESEVRSVREELDLAYASRDSELKVGVHNGLTARLRSMLADRPLTRADIQRKLDNEGFAYKPRNLGVTLATTFDHIPPTEGRRGGKWALRHDDA